MVIMVRYVNYDDMSSILEHVCPVLVTAALNLHGTRSVQRLVELCLRPQDATKITNMIKPYVVRAHQSANPIMDLPLSPGLAPCSTPRATRWFPLLCDPVG